MPARGGPASDEAEGDRSILERLRRDAGPDGFLPFDRFMDLALYSEPFGFYARPANPLGTGGAFYTAPHVLPLFGQALAQRIRSVRRALGGDAPFPVVELGPGDGTLAADLIGALAPGPDDPSTEYVLVERSARLRARTLDRCRAAAERGGVTLRVLPSLAADGPFAGVVVANELLDAQPVRRFRWTGTDWSELGVRVGPDRLLPAERPPVGPLPSLALPTPAEPGTILEVSPAAEAIVREVGDHLTRGLAIVVDFGMSEGELVAGHPRGTLEAIRDHRPAADPLERPGETDLSAFVNFDRLRAVARSSGLVEVAFEPQSAALGRWGFPALLEGAVASASGPEEAVRLRLAAKNLVFGFDRFRVLELSPPSTARALAVSGEEGSPGPARPPGPR